VRPWCIISGYSNGTWYTLTLRADGTALSVQVNGVTRITVTRRVILIWSASAD
jgi:hypothetical protein